MVNKKLMNKYLPKQQTHKVTPIGMMGKEPLILPNYSGVKKALGEGPQNLDEIKLGDGGYGTYTYDARLHTGLSPLSNNCLFIHLDTKSALIGQGCGVGLTYKDISPANKVYVPAMLGVKSDGTNLGVNALSTPLYVIDMANDKSNASHIYLTANPTASPYDFFANPRHGTIEYQYGTPTKLKISTDQVGGAATYIELNPNSHTETAKHIKINADNQKQYFGAGDDAAITYDGTDLEINPKEVGSGDIICSGAVMIKENLEVSGAMLVSGAAVVNSDVDVGGDFQVDGNIDGDGYVSGANLYPERAVMWHQESTVTNGNALQSSTQTSQIYNIGSYQNTPADGDSFTNSFYIKGGTYTINFLGITQNNMGKIDWDIDGSSITTGQDWYSATPVYNTVKSVSNVILSEGYHRITGTVNGKNGSSSNYFITLTKIWVKPATDSART